MAASLRGQLARRALVSTRPRPLETIRLSSTASAASSGSIWQVFGLTSVALALGYGLGCLSPPEAVRILNPRVAPVSPPAESAEGIAATAKVERDLQGLEIVRRLRAERTEDGQPRWVETRPYTRYDEERRRHNLTAGALRGPGKLAVAPICFSTADDKDCYIILHLGRSIGIIHGGLLATVLDESLARPAILNLPSSVGVTAYLNIQYKAPTMADQFVVVHSQCTKLEGRKAWTEGSISTLDGKLLVDAKALFVEPKMASMLDTTSIKQVLGKSM